MFRLLNKSIIRVEQPDVALDDEDDNDALEDDVAEEAEEPMDQDGDQETRKKRISYEEYRRMSFLIIQHIREREEQSEAGSETPGIIKPVLRIHFIFRADLDPGSALKKIDPHPGLKLSLCSQILNKYFKNYNFSPFFVFYAKNDSGIRKFFNHFVINNC